ncbi:MAG: glycosyl hydrolase family 25 [Prevotella sp.]|nr:glycosyl hydrolase family 25 [Prevotella sp.]
MGTLPIIFKRRERRTQTRRHSGYYALLFAVVTVLIICAWVLWVFLPLSTEEQRDSDTRAVIRSRYVVMSGNEVLFAFNRMRGDTLFSNIMPRDKGYVTDTVNAQWVKRWALLPYCGGAIAVEPHDTLPVAGATSEELQRILGNEARHLNRMKKVLREQRKDIDYYLKTHSVTEYGFDMVQRYSRALTAVTDSVNRAYAMVKQALGARNLHVKLEQDCIALDSAAEKFYTRMGRQEALQRLEYRRGKTLTAKERSGIDSLGIYDGGRDSLALPDGIGRFMSWTGDFYEGEWIHGKRQGVGFAMAPGKRLRLGEWKENRFLGERITYHPERIYGIDISRYQHEQGKKRFTIDWGKLRITSLGNYSKKTIEGTVNYPIKFIYIKATEGVTIQNKYFNADYNASRQHGYRTGAYHFFSLKTAGTEQAQNFLSHARYSKGDLPPVLDIEPTDRQISEAGGIDRVFKNVRAWISAIERRWKVKPILYISQRFVNKYLSAAPDLKRNYDVWIARYGEYKPDVNLVYWQLCQDGKVNGIHGQVDINVYNGFEF